MFFFHYINANPSQHRFLPNCAAGHLSNLQFEPFSTLDCLFHFCSEQGGRGHPKLEKIKWYYYFFTQWFKNTMVFPNVIDIRLRYFIGFSSPFDTSTLLETCPNSFFFTREDFFSYHFFPLVPCFYLFQGCFSFLVKYDKSKNHSKALFVTL